MENTSLNYPDIFWILLGKQAWKFEKYLNLHSVKVTEYHPAYFARYNIMMGNWLWRRMLNHVQDRYNTLLNLA